MGWDKLDGSTNTVVTHANVNACTYPSRENALKSVYVRVCARLCVLIFHLNPNETDCHSFCESCMYTINNHAAVLVTWDTSACKWCVRKCIQIFLNRRKIYIIYIQMRRRLLARSNDHFSLSRLRSLWYRFRGRPWTVSVASSVFTVFSCVYLIKRNQLKCYR